jgi:hypothetical protein
MLSYLEGFFILFLIFPLHCMSLFLGNYLLPSENQLGINHTGLYSTGMICFLFCKIGFLCYILSDIVLLYLQRWCK